MSESDGNDSQKSDKFALINQWKERVSSAWKDNTGRLKKLMPLERVAETTVKWFSVSDEQVAEILATVQAKLPTTEALLIGKPPSNL